MPDAPARASGEQRCRFGPLEVAYDDQVLAPRLWTLAQSRWAADLAVTAPPGPLLELCAGAGHIGLAAAVLADRDLVQVEIDPGAAGYALANAREAGRAERVDVRVGALGEVIRPDERFPLVIADPPYLCTADVHRFPADPRLAIDGGDDGLAVVRECLAVAARHLLGVPGQGGLVLQVAGPGQARTVEGAAEAAGLRTEATRVVDEERAVMLLRLRP